MDQARPLRPGDPRYRRFQAHNLASLQSRLELQELHRSLSEDELFAAYGAACRPGAHRPDCAYWAEDPDGLLRCPSAAEPELVLRALDGDR